MSFTVVHVGQSCPSREFLTLQICLFAKMKFSRKFPNLYFVVQMTLDT